MKSIESNRDATIKREVYESRSGKSRIMKSDIAYVQPRMIEEKSVKNTISWIFMVQHDG